MERLQCNHCPSFNTEKISPIINGRCYIKCNDCGMRSHIKGIITKTQLRKQNRLKMQKNA